MVSSLRYTHLAIVLLTAALGFYGCTPPGGGGGGGDDPTEIPGGEGEGDDELPGEGDIDNPGGEGEVDDPGGEGEVDNPGGEGEVDNPGGEGEAEDPPAEHSGSCDTNDFSVVQSQATLEDYGQRLVAVDGQDDYRAILVELRASQEPGVYDLAGTTNLRDCEICVYAFGNCNQGQCRTTFVADEGAVEITEAGTEGGEQVAVNFQNVKFTQKEIDRNTGETSIVFGGSQFCTDGLEVSGAIVTPAARIGDTVPDFSLQNCETGDMVSVREYFGETKAAWFVASAGWCPACRQFLPQVINAANGTAPSQLKPLIIIGEDNNYGQPTLAMCKEYASHYDTDARRFFIDHNGQYGFATTFDNMWPYLGANGEFGLPWNALLNGRDWTYFYADRSGNGDLNSAINSLLSGR